MKKLIYMMIGLCLFLVLATGQEISEVRVQPAITGDHLVSDFEDLTLDPESYWNGEDGSGSFISGKVRFHNDYNAEWRSWSGWAYSNFSDSTTPGLLNQYSAVTGEGYLADSGSSAGGNYGVSYAIWPSVVDFKDGKAHKVAGLRVTNSTYAALSMKYGDDYAKKFGGADGSDPDYFKLLIWGRSDGNNTDSIEFYLADFRFDDHEKDYIIKTWDWVDLSSLGKVDSLLFVLTSSDMSDWGMNTPGFFCLDDIHVIRDDITGGAEAQYISEVFVYVPAPGQFTNTTPWGSPVAAASLLGGVNGSMCLGAFGGFVVFGFGRPVDNHPDNPFGVDFTIFGNPQNSWSEPGAVWVMRDDNNNGLPDDTWYELAGSDYYFSSTVKDYEVTYLNPGDTIALDVPWMDNTGNNGFISANSIHTQSYYPERDSFPAIPNDQYTLTGTRIDASVQTNAPPLLVSAKRAFGYADNQIRGNTSLNLPDNPYTPEVENSGGDACDIEWAVDSTGAYVELDRIHFVKVQNAVLEKGGWLGELSTEVTGAVDVIPDRAVTGELEMIVIRDLPVEITNTTYPLEAFVFQKGRVQPGRAIQWTSNMPEATVDEQHVLRLTGSGSLVLTASLIDRPEITTTISTSIFLDETRLETRSTIPSEIQLFPNPAHDFTNMKGVKDLPVSLYDVTGKCWFSMVSNEDSFEIDLTELPVGLYMIRIDHGNQVSWHKLLKE